MRVLWKEDVHHWHPGQQWIWEPGGFGVFDPGINALSVLTEVLSNEVCVETAVLEFPENQQAPIAANLQLRAGDGVTISAEFDFRQKGEQSWDIELFSTDGRLKLTRGGSGLAIDDHVVAADPGLTGEYPRLYSRFAALCAAGTSEVDWRPFQLVADAFLIGEQSLAAKAESLVNERSYTLRRLPFPQIARKTSRLIWIGTLMNQAEKNAAVARG